MKNIFRNIVTLLLVLSLAFVFSGCSPEKTNSPEETVTPTKDVEPESTPVTTPEETPSASVETPAPTKEVEEIRPASKEPPVYEVPEVGENGLIDLAPLFTSNDARTVGFVVYNDYEKAFSLFDGTAERIMNIPDMTSAEIIFHASAPIRVDYFSVVSANDASNLPVKFTLYGSKDNTFKNCVMLYSTDTLVIPTDDYTESDLLKTACDDYFQCFKLSVESVNGGSCISIGELNFFADPANEQSCIGPYETFNSDISNYTVLNAHIKPRLVVMEPDHDGSSAKNLFDCNIETHDYMTLQWGKDHEAISYIFIADSDITIDAYRFTTAERAEGSPMSWKLYGSYKKNMLPEDLILLDERTEEAMPIYEYGESDVYTVQNPGTYKYYQIVFTESAMIGNDENWLTIDISEMTLLANK